MTVNEIISVVDKNKPNKVGADEKIKWLEILDGTIYEEVILTHKDSDEVELLKGYDLSTELIVKEPYAEKLYTYWLYSHIDLVNGENGKYNNDTSIFNDAYTAFTSYYNRKHFPLGAKCTYY